MSTDCQKILELAATAVSQSQLLRMNIRQTITSAISKQRAAHHCVNDGLIKKIAETVTLKVDMENTTKDLGLEFNMEFKVFHRVAALWKEKSIP